MKISYVTDYDALDIHNWSGTGFYIAKMLENQKAEIDYIGNLQMKSGIILKSKKVISKLTGKKFYIERNPNVSKQYAEQIKLKLKANTDIVFSPGSILTALLDTNKPKVFYTDATFAGMVGFYEPFTGLCSETIKHGNYLEQKALESSKLIIYSSDWAAKTAIDNYNVDPNKIKVVPFGANIQSNRDLKEIKSIINNRVKNECNLLFIGVEWKRKGGDLAIKIAHKLNVLGLKTTLHIVGLNKIPIHNMPDFVINHGFISKSTEEGKSKINELLSKSHFLLVPSIAEAYGLVFCEANSFGLPSISTNVGGIPTVIKDDINGKTFALNTDVDIWCEYILNSFKNNKKYIDFCTSSFEEYNTRLNWNVAGKTIMSLLREL